MTLLDQPKFHVKYALILLIKEIFAQLDEVASLKSQGSKAHLSLLSLRETCSVLGELSPEEQQEYLEMLVSIVTRDNPPCHAIYDDEYAKHSINAKRRFLERIRCDLRPEAA